MCYCLTKYKLLKSLKADFGVIEQKIKDVVPMYTNILSKKDSKKIAKRYVNRYESIISGDMRITSSSFIDILTLAYNGNELAVAIINHVKKCVEIVGAYIASNPRFAPAYYNILKNMIMSFDVDVSSNNNDFKNWISELSIFSKLCQESIEIIDIEKPLGNGRSADFSCRILGSNELCTFDVVTYQNIDPSLHETSESMNQFLNKRILEKFSYKTQGIAQEDHKEFRILPILEYKAGMEKFMYSVDSSISLPIMAYFANIIDGKTEFCLMSLNDLCNELRTRTQIDKYNEKHY